MELIVLQISAILLSQHLLLIHKLTIWLISLTLSFTP
jgi:hypothetical protein